jgi:hypothetical protein
VPIATALARLPHLPPPVLSVYLDTNPATERNQNTPRGYQIWLKAAGQALAREVEASARPPLRRQLERVAEYLDLQPAKARGTAIFAGAHVWEVVPLQMPVHDEIHWGKPALQQLTWLLDEHRSRGAVLIEGTGARFFRFWLGQISEDEDMAFVLDRSQWRDMSLTGPAPPGVGKHSGAMRERVAARVDAAWKRFAAAVARRLSTWMRREGISPVALVGEPRLIEPVISALGAGVRSSVRLVPKTLPRTSAAQVQKQLEPVLRDWEREYEQQQVDDLLNTHDPARAVLGLDETLARLQQGRVRELVVAGGLRGNARQCLQCGWADRSADPVCPVCGGERRPRTLRTLIPELASAHGVPIEVVAGAAADRLREAGGIGAWLGRRRRAAA